MMKKNFWSEKNVLINWFYLATPSSAVCWGCRGSGDAVVNNVKCILSCCYSWEWNGGMMPFITIISFAKWGSSPQLPTLTWDQYQSLVSVSSPDWNMMQVSPHGGGGATSSTQHVVYSVVAGRCSCQLSLLLQHSFLCNILIYSVRVRWTFFIGVLKNKIISNSSY